MIEKVKLFKPAVFLSLKHHYWRCTLSSRFTESMKTARLCSTLLFTISAAAITGDDALAGTSNWLCSYNNGPRINTKAVFNGSQTKLYWSDGPVTTLNKVEDREYIDSYGGRWLRMSNTNFFGIWNPQNENRISCFFN